MSISRPSFRTSPPNRAQCVASGLSSGDPGPGVGARVQWPELACKGAPVGSTAVEKGLTRLDVEGHCMPRPCVWCRPGDMYLRPGVGAEVERPGVALHGFQVIGSPKQQHAV